MLAPPLDYDSSEYHSPALRELVELVRYRYLLRLLVVNSIKSRYKRSVLGLLWTLLGPLLTMAVLTFAFSTLFHSATQNYPLYVLAGLILWNFFAQTTTMSMNWLIWRGSLLKQVYMPRTIFAVAAVGNGLVNLLLALIPLVILMLAMGQPFRPALFFLPVAVFLTALFVLGISLFTSTLAVFFTDVVDVHQIALQAWFYLTPVMYPASIISPRFRWFIALNPVHHLLELFRVPIYLGVMPPAENIAAATISAFAALIIGWWVFTRKAHEIAYRL